MDMPQYNGVIEPWKVKLIIHRAKLHGFRTYEIPDALQEIVLVVLDFNYDPNHADGATERTALTAIVDNRLRNMKRSATRYRMHLERFGDDATELSWDEIDLCAIDTTHAVADLSKREQIVCRGLAGGLSKNQIAKALGCSWHTVERMIRRLQKHFKALGLNEWAQA